MKKTSAVLTRARRKVRILGPRRRCRLEGRENRRVVPAARSISQCGQASHVAMRSGIQLGGEIVNQPDISYLSQ